MCILHIYVYCAYIYMCTHVDQCVCVCAYICVHIDTHIYVYPAYVCVSCILIYRMLRVCICDECRCQGALHICIYIRIYVRVIHTRSIRNICMHDTHMYIYTYICMRDTHPQHSKRYPSTPFVRSHIHTHTYTHTHTHIDIHVCTYMCTCDTHTCVQHSKRYPSTPST